MPNQSLATAALLFVVSAHAGATSPAWALPAAEAQALRLFDAGRFRDAARLYEGMRREASAHSCNLGLCHAKLSEAASAATAIESCLEGGAPWMEVATRADYQELLSRLRARLASRRPATLPGNDGDPIATGVRLIAVNPPPPVAASLIPPAPLVRVAPPTPAPARAPAARGQTPPAERDLAKSRPALDRHARAEGDDGNEAVIVTGIPGLLGAGIGFGFLLHRNGLSREIATLQTPPPGQTEITPEMNAALARLREQRDTATRRAQISFIVGGLGLFASMIAAATSTDNQDDDGVSLVLGPGSAGIAGRF